MEEERGKGIRVDMIPETLIMPHLPQPGSICQSMQEQENHQLQQSSRGICVGNLPGLGTIPFTHLLALANAASTSSLGVASPGYGMDSASSTNSLVDSCRTESSSGIWDRGSSLEPHIGSAEEKLIEKSQYEVSTSQQHFYDLNLLPEEMISTIPQTTEAEFAPITPEKPGRKLPERQDPCFVSTTDQKSQESAKDSLLHAGSAATEKNHNKRKRERKVSCFEVAGKAGQERQELVKDSFLDAGSAATEKSHKKANSERDNVQQIKTPQQKPKRKKHRPKVVIEGKPNRSSKSEILKAAEPKRKKSKNRGCVKENEELTSMQMEAATETSDFKSYNRPKRSTRRALNFDYDILQEDGSFEFTSSSDSELQAQKNDYSPGGGEGPTTLSLMFSNIPKRRRRSSPADRYDNDSKTEQISSCNDQEKVARDWLPSGHENTMLMDARLAEKSKNVDTTANRTKDTSTDSPQIQCKSLHMFQTMFLVQFPNIPRKRRTDGSNFTISRTSAEDIFQQETISQHFPCMAPSELGSDYLCSMQPGVKGPTTNFEEPEEDLPPMVHTSQWFAELNHPKKLRKKRSRTVTRARNFRSLKRILKSILPRKSDKREHTASHRPQRLEAIVSDMQSTVSRKKRTKRNSIMSRLHARTLQMQWRVYAHYRLSLSAKPIGTSPDGLWKQLFSIDAISEWFEQLDINKESPYIPHHRKNALVLHRTRYQEQNALVLYTRDGSIIPFGNFSYPPKRKLPRPMVKLDDETTRVWNLLMINVNSEGIDGTDEEKQKWWKEERTVFHGRANSFIARMRLVQGDRRFSPWKGSVVDSVVGVFLTQNVSDHLSSSAFMTMAAEFPIKLNAKKRPYNEWGSSLTHEPLMYLEDSGDVGSTQPNCNPNCIIIHEINHEEDNDAVYSAETSRISGSFTSATKESKILPLNSPTNGLETNFSSGTKGRVHYDNDQREIPEPSQDSLLSQDSETLSPAMNDGATGSCSISKTEKTDFTNGFSLNSLAAPFPELLEMSHSPIQQRHGSANISKLDAISENNHSNLKMVEGERQIPYNNQIDSSQGISTISSSSPSFRFILNQGMLENSKSFRDKTDEGGETMSSYQQEENIILLEQNKEENRRIEQHVNTEKSTREILDMTESSSLLENQLNTQSETSESERKEEMCQSRGNKRTKASTPKSKGGTARNEKKSDFDWDSLRRQAESGIQKEDRTTRTMDSVDWEAVRCADVDKIAKIIRARGMNNMLSERIKGFLDRLVRDHGSIDLEWLRDVPPDKAKEYLLSIKGLGLKSVECVRLLTLHHLAFPVDTNVGRIAVRLGWVPLQPLPESLQLHLLELYPILESIQKYLWPRLCKLDQETLYELHYHMITFGKVFCTKSKPNCNSCPLRGECRHFASAFASARLALPGPEEKRIIKVDEREVHPEPVLVNFRQSLFLPQGIDQPQTTQTLEAPNSKAKSESKTCEPIIEEPATPEPECTQVPENDIEDLLCDDPDEIPTIRLNMEAFTMKLQNMDTELREGDVSTALVALSTEAASIPMPKLKNLSRLRTEHEVYELPDSHPLLDGLDKREPDDPCSYLLAIWTPGETADSIQPPEKKCVSQENNILCHEKTCLSCNRIREEKSQTVRGTLLIPCRTAMRGSFPLNGTYFQVNEVFADHESSLNPIEVPRDWIWNLPRRTVYFGTSISAIFRGLTTQAIQHCFWRGYVCLRGFDQKTRAPRPLRARLHFPASKRGKRNFRTNEDDR